MSLFASEPDEERARSSAPDVGVGGGETSNAEPKFLIAEPPPGVEQLRSWLRT
jgi:hypothetical protein